MKLVLRRHLLRSAPRFLPRVSVFFSPPYQCPAVIGTPSSTSPGIPRDLSSQAPRSQSASDSSGERYAFTLQSLDRSLVSRNKAQTSMAANKPLKVQDPVQRPASPYSDPQQLGPRSRQLAQGTSNFHSTSLRTMVTNSVNKTALHPGGVQYVDALP